MLSSAFGPGAVSQSSNWSGSVDHGHKLICKHGGSSTPSTNVFRSINGSERIYVAGIIFPDLLWDRRAPVEHTQASCLGERKIQILKYAHCHL